MSRNMESGQTGISRRVFISGGLATVALAGSGLAAVACSDDNSSAVTPTPTASAGNESPVPRGKIAQARDAALPPLGSSPLELTFTATDLAVEIAAGVPYKAWSFQNEIPGPVVHVKQGDTVRFTLVNEGGMGHSMDFHSARTPWDKNYVTIAPGKSISFDWTADFPGVFMYHCGTPPVLEHIANGMYGAVVVDPDPPLPLAREYVLVQSEFYAKKGSGSVWEGDLDKMLAARPDLLTFNGAAFQYRDNPLPVSVGENIRLYVLNAGPTLFSAFHVIGAIFDKVYIDGNPANTLKGISTYTVAPGQGCTFELAIPEAGLYPFVTHSFAYTELGAIGLLKAI